MMIRTNLNKLFFLLFIITASCNNNNQGNINENEDQDIRIEGYQKQSETNKEYANNDVGEYLKYISGEGSVSYVLQKNPCNYWRQL